MEKEYSIVWIYVITGLVSLVIAQFLVHWSRLSAAARLKLETQRLQEGGAVKPISDESLTQAVFEEIAPLVDSRQHRSDISKKVAGIFNKELEKQVNATAQELTRKYETAIERHSQNEEIAWEKYKKVLTEKKATEAVIHSVAEGLVVIGREGEVLMMNPAAEKILGASRKEKIGKSILENLKEEQLVSLAKASSGKENLEIELISPRDDTKKVLRASTAVIEDENGQTVGMVSVLSDITKQRELDNLKSNFVSNVSHELRTPLVAIGKSLSLLLTKTAGEINDNQQQFLSIADHNVKRLGRLIDDLLDLAKLEAGKLDLRRAPSSVEKIANDVVASFAAWENSKGLTLEKKVQENIPQANIDPDRITQVLTNLVGNAIKFTPSGGRITVAASYHPDRREIEIAVQDNGLGIAAENIPRIFSKFYQVGERSSADMAGTGIGLSITKEIVELHGGRIWAESQKGQGARFAFTLPLEIG